MLLLKHPFISYFNSVRCVLVRFFFLWLYFFFPHLQSIKRKDDPQEVKVQMQFMVYGTRPSKDKSGAYLFLPDGKAKVLLSLSQRLYVRCLLASQEALIDSLLCIVSLYHAGVLGAGRQADWVLLHLLIDFFFLTQLSTKDSLEHSRHLWLHFSLSLLYSLIYLPTALSLLPLSALQPEGAARGARGGGAALLRGGGTLPAFPADDSHKQRAR